MRDGAEKWIFCADGVDRCGNLCYNQQRPQNEELIGELCNGSTYDSDSYCLGSNPSSPAISLHGQAVKTLPSQGKIMGSIPIGGATSHRFACGFFICISIAGVAAIRPLPACLFTVKILPHPVQTHIQRFTSSYTVSILCVKRRRGRKPAAPAKKQGGKPL